MCMDHPVKEEGPFLASWGRQKGRAINSNIITVGKHCEVCSTASLPPVQWEGRQSECCCRLLGTTMAKSCGRFESGLPSNNWLNPIRKSVTKMKSNQDKSWTSLVNPPQWRRINLILHWPACQTRCHCGRWRNIRRSTSSSRKAAYASCRCQEKDVGEAKTQF